MRFKNNDFNQEIKTDTEWNSIVKSDKYFMFMVDISSQGISILF